MTEDDKARFATIMAGMAESFNATISKPGLMVRFAALNQYSIEKVEQACMECVRSHRYTNMPTVAEIIDCIGGGRIEDRAEIEAAKVWRAVGDVGAYRDIVFDDAVTQAVIEYGFGGWSKMCSELMVDRQSHFQREFSRLYGAYARQNIERVGKLTGLASTREPALIGDRQKCLEIAAQKNREITGPAPVTALLGDVCGTALS